MGTTLLKIQVAETYNEMQETLDALKVNYQIGDDSCILNRLEEKIGAYADAEIDFHVAVCQE